MAVPTFTNLTTNASGTDQSAYVTASIAPTAGRVLLAGIANERASSATAAQPSLSGGGVSSWTLVGTLTANTDERLSIFRANVGASPSSGAVTIDFSAETQNSCAWSIVEAADVLTTGTNAADAVAQFEDASASGSSALSVTLGSALGAADNRILVFGFIRAASRTVTWDTGYADVSGAQASASGISLVAGYGRNGDSQVVSGTWSGGGNLISMAAEVVGFVAADTTIIYPRITRRRLPGGLL